MSLRRVTILTVGQALILAVAAIILLNSGGVIS